MAWGVAEATLFFVVPDAAVGWVALRRPRQLPATWLAVVAGGVAGTVLVHQAARGGWDPGPLFDLLPGARKDDRRRAREALARGPIRAFLLGSVSGIPVKVFVAEAARQDLPMARVMGLAMLNRAPRVGLFGLALVCAGALGRRRRLSADAMGAAYLLGRAVFYAWYWVLRPDRG
jgi:hypothetical protein